MEGGLPAQCRVTKFPVISGHGVLKPIIKDSFSTREPCAVRSSGKRLELIDTGLNDSQAEKFGGQNHSGDELVDSRLPCLSFLDLRSE
jgi:hypothetical protein